LLATAIGLRLAGQQILIVHMVPILVSRDVGEVTAASLVALMSLMRLPSVIGAGFLGDMWSRQKVSALAMVAGSIAAAIAIWGPDGLSMGIAFAILFAGAQAGNAITWALIGHYFGRRNFASLRGGITLVQSLMSTVGPVVAGWVFDTTGSYNGALLGVLSIYGLSALVFWNLKVPTKAHRERR
jgi:MFS family permease